MLLIKATILGVFVNSSSASLLLREIIELALGKTYNGAPVIPTDRAEGEEVEESLSAIPAGERDPSTLLAYVGIVRDDKKQGGDGDKPLIVFTPNPEFLVEASRDSEFRELLNKADVSLPDGIGLVLASRLLGCPIKEQVSGADVVERLLEIGNRKLEVGSGSGSEGGKWEVGRPHFAKASRGEEVRVGSGKWVVGIAGARRGVLEESVELVKRLQEKYPNINFINLDEPKLSIINYQLSNNDQNPNYQKRHEAKLRQVLKIGELDNSLKIENCKLNIVFACQGMKRQENWIWENKEKISTNVFMGIGGSLDFVSGFSKRAPKILRAIGLEWLWRGLQKPTHFKRIWKATFVFGYLVAKEFLKKGK